MPLRDFYPCAFIFFFILCCQLYEEVYQNMKIEKKESRTGAATRCETRERERGRVQCSKACPSSLSSIRREKKTRIQKTHASASAAAAAEAESPSASPGTRLRTRSPSES